MATRVVISANYNNDSEEVEAGSASGEFEFHRPDHYGLGGLVRLKATPLHDPEALIKEFLAEFEAAVRVVVRGRDEQVESLTVKFVGGKVSLLVNTIILSDIAEIKRRKEESEERERLRK